MTKQICFIGLGKMGQNMVLHLLEEGVHVVGYNRTKEVTEEFASNIHSREACPNVGTFTPTSTIEELITYNLQPTTDPSHPRIVWLMVPNGKPVDDVIAQLLEAGLVAGDVIIDGGNCYYKDSIRRAKDLEEKGIHFIDCGTSGGLEGAANGACLMLGGNKELIESLSWLFDTIATKPLGGWAYMGPSGAGDYVKMVHNGIEYSMNEALGEGFDILAHGPYPLDLTTIAKTWSHGSVVRGWLVELLARALEKDPHLDGFKGNVGGGETGRWTVEAGKEAGVATTVIEDALQARINSQTNPTFSGKVISALRHEYGGHTEK